MMKFSTSPDVLFGTEVLLICNYQPPATAQWLHNGTLLSDGAGGMNIIGGTLGDSLTVLHVTHASQNNEGTYTCIVTNTAASVKAEFDLHIHGEEYSVPCLHFTSYTACLASSNVLRQLIQ